MVHLRKGHPKTPLLLFLSSSSSSSSSLIFGLLMPSVLALRCWHLYLFLSDRNGPSNVSGQSSLKATGTGQAMSVAGQSSLKATGTGQVMSESRARSKRQERAKQCQRPELAQSLAFPASFLQTLSWLFFASKGALLISLHLSTEIAPISLMLSTTSVKCAMKVGVLRLWKQLT